MDFLPNPIDLSLMIFVIAPLAWATIFGALVYAIVKGGELRNTALNIAAVWAGTKVISAGIVAYLSIMRLNGVVIPTDTVLPMLIIALLLPLLPALLWLYAFVAKRF